jgi:hypothetical protein
MCRAIVQPRIEVKRGKFRGDAVLSDSGPCTALPYPGGDGILGGIVEPWIKEIAGAVHLQVGDISIPISDRAPGAGRGVVVDAGQRQVRLVTPLSSGRRAQEGLRTASGYSVTASWKKSA